MAIHKSRASETARLIADVVAGTPLAVDAATARLIVLGARGVRHVQAALAEAMARRDDQTAARLLDILAQISTKAAFEAVAASGGEAAGPLHAASIIDAWQAALDVGDRVMSTRALDHLTALALDAAAARPARRQALDALRRSAPDVVGPLVARLGHDLDADDARAPATVVRPLDEVPIDTVAGLDELRARLPEESATATLSALHRIVSALRSEEARRAEGERQHLAQVRTLVHQALARRQSTVALYDLRDSFERDPAPLPVGMFAAIADLGDAASLDALAAAWLRMDDAWTRDHLRDAAAAIIARHGLGPRHAAMKRVVARCPDLVDAISTPSRSTPSRPPARRT